MWPTFHDATQLNPAQASASRRLTYYLPPWVSCLRLMIFSSSFGLTGSTLFHGRFTQGRFTLTLRAMSRTCGTWRSCPTSHVGKLLTAPPAEPDTLGAVSAVENLRFSFEASKRPHCTSQDHACPLHSCYLGVRRCLVVLPWQRGSVGTPIIHTKTPTHWQSP